MFGPIFGFISLALSGYGAYELAMRAKRYYDLRQAAGRLNVQVDANMPIEAKGVLANFLLYNEDPRALMLAGDEYASMNFPIAAALLRNKALKMATLKGIRLVTSGA